MHRPPPAIRHLIAHRVAFAVVILTALTTATFTAAAVSFFSAVTSGAAASELSGRPGSVITVSAPATRATIGRTSADIARTVRGLLPGLRPLILSSSQSDVLNLPGPKSSGRPQTQVISLPGLGAHIIQVSGHCGAGSLPAQARALPACMPANAARALGLATGDAVTLRDPTTHARIRVRITGTFRRVSTTLRQVLAKFNEFFHVLRFFTKKCRARIA